MRISFCYISVVLYKLYAEVPRNWLVAEMTLDRPDDVSAGWNVNRPIIITIASESVSTSVTTLRH